jgi:hypothetical protein
MLTASARVFLCHTAVFLLACLLSSQLLAQSPSVGGPNTFRFSDSLVSRPFLSSQEGEGGGAEGSEEAGESEREFEEEEEEELETDRDSFTPATSTVARGRLLVESAYSLFPETYRILKRKKRSWRKSRKSSTEQSSFSVNSGAGLPKAASFCRASHRLTVYRI